LSDRSITLHSEPNHDNDLKLFPAIPLPPITGCCSRHKSIREKSNNSKTGDWGYLLKFQEAQHSKQTFKGVSFSFKKRMNEWMMNLFAYLNNLICFKHWTEDTKVCSKHNPTACQIMTQRERYLSTLKYWENKKWQQRKRELQELKLCKKHQQQCWYYY
jgi:phosphomevalonate kinase